MTYTAQVKLPKQWKHWCADQKLRIHGRKCGNRQSQWFYLEGHGRYWRVNCYGQFQCGDTYDDFDRWALSDIAELPLPKTRAEFRTAVSQMLLEHVGPGELT